MREPQVVRQPSAQKRSLWAIGMPVRGAASPRPSRASAARAWARLRSASTVMKAFSFPSRRAMRSRKACVSSTLESARLRSRACELGEA